MAKPTDADEIPTITQRYASGALSVSEGEPEAKPDTALNDRVCLWEGDITNLAVDAVVNAANPRLLGGAGVDGAIHIAAGPELLNLCRTLDGCTPGNAVSTPAFNMPCRRILHTVGPRFNNTNEQARQLLRSCYTRCLQIAAKQKLRTIAFPCISTGIYGYPSGLAALEAASAVRDFLSEDKEQRIRKVIFVNFRPVDVEAYNVAIPLYFPPWVKPIFQYLHSPSDFGGL